MRIRRLRIEFCVLLIVIAAGTLQAQSILVLDYGSEDNVAQDALNNLALPFTLTSDPPSFDTELTGGTEWDLVIVDNPSNSLTAGVETNLTDYINNGGKLLFSYWDLDVADPLLQAALGVAATTSLTTPTEIHDWGTGSSLWARPNGIGSPITVEADSWLNNGDAMTAAPGAVAIGGFTPGVTAGEAAIIVGNGGRTITFGHEFDSLDEPAITGMIENAVQLCLQNKHVLLVEDTSVGFSTTAHDALDAEGLIFDQVSLAGFNPALTSGIAWDLVVAEIANFPFVTDDLEAYIASDGKVFISYWDLNNAVSLQASLGVSVASSFLAPMEIFDWGAGGSAGQIWTTPNAIGASIPMTADAFANNGDRLVGVDGVEAGGFTLTPTPNEAAVVIKNDGNCITVGHDFISLQQPEATNFVQNCIHRLCNPPPANDDCANALAVIEGDHAYSNTLATTDGPSPCGAIGSDIWYSYTAPEAGTVTLSTCLQATYDTALAIYPGDPCPADAVDALACNDDFPGCGLTSTTTYTMASGETILIQVGGFAGGMGDGTLTISFAPAPLPTDVSGFDVVLVNGEGDVDGGLVVSQLAYTAALTTAGLSFIEIEPNVLGQTLVGCPAVAWIYNNGTFPDDAPVDAAIMEHLRDCVLAGNAAMANGGDMWGFLPPTAYDDIDGIDTDAASDGGDTVTDLEGVAGSSLDGFVSAYVQDQLGNDWTDVLALAAIGAGTEIMGENQELALFSPAAAAAAGADYNVGVYYPHDETVAPGAGDTFSMSIEPAGVDDPATFLADCFALVFFPAPDGEVFSRGDCNNDGLFDIGDAIAELDILFGGTGPAACDDACDANDDGLFDIGDPISVLSTLFAMGDSPPAPSFPECGLDPTDDLLGCDTQPVEACADLK